MTGGVSGAAGLPQFPEFSQHCLQRHAVKVDALSAVVEDFDASAIRNSLTRVTVAKELAGTAFLADWQADMRRNFVDHARLAADLDRLRDATTPDRLTMPQRLGDSERLTAAWADFRPAIPVALDGAVSAGVRYVVGWGLLAGLWALLCDLFRRAGCLRASHNCDVGRAHPA
jgi:hypothetical protein